MKASAKPEPTSKPAPSLFPKDQSLAPLKSLSQVGTEWVPCRSFESQMSPSLLREMNWLSPEPQPSQDRSMTRTVPCSRGLFNLTLLPSSPEEGFPTI